MESIIAEEAWPPAFSPCPSEGGRYIGQGEEVTGYTEQVAETSSQGSHNSRIKGEEAACHPQQVAEKEDKFVKKLWADTEDDEESEEVLGLFSSSQAMARRPSGRSPPPRAREALISREIQIC